MINVQIQEREVFNSKNVASCMSLDRPELLFFVKECSRGIYHPLHRLAEALNRLARYYRKQRRPMVQLASLGFGLDPGVILIL